MIPADLVRLYGGPLELPSPGLYANFVSSIDGVVALGHERNSGSLISGKSQADRFVMGLLRAFADAVFVGAGTMRAEGKGALWTPDYIYPAAADAFAELRRRLELPPQPQLAILTASGEILLPAPPPMAGALPWPPGPPPSPPRPCHPQPRRGWGWDGAGAFRWP